MHAILQVVWHSERHAVRIPVSVMFPFTIPSFDFVTNTSASFTQDFTILAPPGVVDIQSTGLLPGDVHAVEVQQSQSGNFTLTVPEGTYAVAVGLFAADYEPDIDLDLYVLDAEGNSVAVSNGPAGNDERINRTDLPAGNYTVDVVGFDLRGAASITAYLYSWLLPSFDNPVQNGLMQVVPTAVTINDEGLGPAALVFNGLDFSTTPVNR